MECILVISSVRPVSERLHYLRKGDSGEITVVRKLLTNNAYKGLYVLEMLI